ncbi:hypothetical protein [Mucilaginibacter sp.]|uniref:lipopolysaccharide biosynthesis protein n=1 Tax=Mucilaginibacter sp. TaxID=1882438 RepID=UPI0025F4ECEE|nr:hypothetical protein [Mucilaginibacter sp.]
MKSIIKVFSAKLGIDGAIAYTILTRVIQAGSGLISIIFIAKFLSSNEQGYYYTFASVLAIQIFFELGLSGIITQYAAHEFAHLSLTADFQLAGEEFHKSRLSSLLRFCVKWFAIISGILFFILLAVGFFFFSSYNKDLNISWHYPWVILCVATSLNLFIDPVLAFFDGLNQVKDMSKVRLIQKIANIVLLFVFFLCGFKLYAAALASLIAIGINYIQVIFSNRIKLLKAVWRAQSKWKINYLKEIFPLQWKIALSWISGYFIFQLFIPVLFATEGPIVAGQMGMTLAALNGVLSVSISWITTKVPLFSGLIAKKEYEKLNEKFNLITKQACLICALCLGIFIIFVEIVRHFHFPVGNRFLPTFPLVLLTICTFISQFIFALATYLRCHKKEPFLVQSIVMGILSALSTIFLGKYFGVNGITIGYTTLMIFAGLLWVTIIFKNKKLEWHH